MSGPRPAYLFRRGAVYAVRFRIPSDLVPRLGLTEVRRSLFTADPKRARERCHQATVWFHNLISCCRMTTQFDPKDFEHRARIFFDGFKEEIEVPPATGERAFQFDPDEQRDHSLRRIDELVHQLQTYDFDKPVRVRALNMAADAGFAATDLDDKARAYIKSLVARAELEALRFHLHWLADPVAAYEPIDPFFKEARPVLASAPLANSSTPGIKLATAVGECLKDKQRTLAEKTIVEMRRTLGWFIEFQGADTPLSHIDRKACRKFRDALLTLKSGLQGTGNLAFADRRTEVTALRISSVTAAKYWSFVQSFFGWTVEVGELEASPTREMPIKIAVSDKSKSPQPFSTDEVKRFLSTPLYAGHSGKRLLQPGPDLYRGSHYWSGLIGLFTGARAGGTRSPTFCGTPTFKRTSSTRLWAMMIPR